MKTLVIFIMVALVGTLFVNQAYAQQQGTFALWRINAAIPGEQVEVSIADANDLYTYTLTLPDKLKTHPHNTDIKYYDFQTYLPVTLKENEMAIMCVVPLNDDSQGYQCTEIFVTKNMARGIVYYNFDLGGNQPGYMFT